MLDRISIIDVKPITLGRGGNIIVDENVNKPQTETSESIHIFLEPL